MLILFHDIFGFYKQCSVWNFLSKFFGNVRMSKCCPEVFCKNGVVKKAAKFTEKHLCWRLYLIKLQAFRKLQKLQQEYCIWKIFDETEFTETKKYHGINKIDTNIHKILQNYFTSKYWDNIWNGCFWTVLLSETN